MNFIRSQWSLLTMVTAVALAALLSSLVEASDDPPPYCEKGDKTVACLTVGQPIEITPPKVDAIKPNGTTANPDMKNQQGANDSILKQYLFDNSFDKAADANATLGSRPTAMNYDQDKYKNDTKYKAIVDTAYAEIKIAKTANEIADEQRIMADVGRVSDTVGVAAVGAAMAKETFKNPTQANSLESVANMEKIGGQANMIAGATDLALASKAYFDQKKRLEEIQQKIAEAQAKNKPVDMQLQRQLQDAIKKTKDAAISHAVYGAGKMVAGSLSLQAAQSNLEAKKALEDAAANPSSSGISTTNYAPSTLVSNRSLSSLTPTLSPPPVTGGRASTVTTAGSTTGGSMAGPLINYKKDPFTAPKNDGTSKGSSITGGSSLPNNAKSDDQKTAADDKEATKEILAGSEYNLLGGGGWNKGGRSPAASDGVDMTSILTSLLGGGDKPAATVAAAAGSGIAPAYDAVTGDAGIGNAEVSLFESTRAKYAQMWEQGRLAGVKGVIK